MTKEQYIDSHCADDSHVSEPYYCNCGNAKENCHVEMCKDCESDLKKLKNYIETIEYIYPETPYIITHDIDTLCWYISPFILNKDAKYSTFHIPANLIETILCLFWNFTDNLKKTNGVNYLIVESDELYHKLKLY